MSSTHKECVEGTVEYEQHLIPAIPVPKYPELNMGWPAVMALHDIWRKKRPDIIHIVTEGPLGWAALFVGRYLGIPVSTDFRTNFHEYSRHYGLGWLRSPIFNSLRFFHNTANSTLVPTPSLRDHLVNHGFRNVRVVSRGVDTAAFDPVHRNQALRNSWGASESSLVFLYVGRVAAEKNLSTLIKAFEKARSLDVSAKLIIVGDGPLIDELQSLCPQAVFTGALSGQELSMHYASADVFLFPSLTETYGNVTAEALASGLPVIAFSKGASAALVRSGVNGICVEGTSDEAFISAALSLTSHKQELPLLRMAARKEALHLSWNKIISQFETELFSLLAT